MLPGSARAAAAVCKAGARTGAASTAASPATQSSALQQRGVR